VLFLHEKEKSIGPSGFDVYQFHSTNKFPLEKEILGKGKRWGRKETEREVEEVVANMTKMGIFSPRNDAVTAGGLKAPPARTEPGFQA